MSTGPCISLMLDQQLDLIGKNDTERDSNPTASSQLLAQRQKTKNIENSQVHYNPFINVIGISHQKPETQKKNLISQISKSEVESPKYWGTTSQASSKQRCNSRKAHKVANKKKVEKAENYKGRQSEKLMIKLNAKVRKKKLKSN